MKSKHPASVQEAAKAAAHARKRSKRNLVALGSAAVLAVYAAGYLRTSAAAHKLADMERKRPGAPNDPGAREVALVPAALSSTGAPPTSEMIVATTPAPPEVVAIPAGTSAPVTTAPVAPAPTVTVSVPVATNTAPAKPAYKDGAFYGWGYCRHGNLKVILQIKDGRIESATIAECYTRYSQNVIAMLPGQVVARQSPNVDRISRASDSSDAFYYAVVEALKAAKT